LTTYDCYQTLSALKNDSYSYTKENIFDKTGNQIIPIDYGNALVNIDEYQTGTIENHPKLFLTQKYNELYEIIY